MGRRDDVVAAQCFVLLFRSAGHIDRESRTVARCESQGPALLNGYRLGEDLRCGGHGNGECFTGCHLEREAGEISRHTRFAIGRDVHLRRVVQRHVIGEIVNIAILLDGTCRHIDIAAARDFFVGSRKFDAEDTFRRCEVLDRHLTDGDGTAETHLQFGRLTLHRDRFGDQQVRVRIETRSGRLLDCGSDDLHVGDVRIAGGNPCRGGINRVINERSVRILRERYGEFRRAVAYRTFLRVGVCGFGGGRFEHLKVFAGFVPRDFPRQGIIRRTGTGCRFEFRRCGDRHRYFTTVRRVGNRVVFGTGYEQRCTHCDSQNGFEKSFHSRRMCLLVFSVIGVINAAACFAGSAIVQDSAVGKTFLDRDAEDLNRRSGVRSSPPP